MAKYLIIRIFHSVPGVPRAKMERFAGMDYAFFTL
jgi:hypothetical protein